MISFILITSALYLVKLLFAAFFSCLLITHTYRFVRSQIRGSRYIRKPDEFKFSLVHRPIYEGIELIVGYEDEVQDNQILRYSISPEMTGEETGTIFRVDSVTRNHYEIRKL